MREDGVSPRLVNPESPPEEAKSLLERPGEPMLRPRLAKPEPPPEGAKSFLGRPGERLESNVTLIDVLRHGEPQGGRRYRGQMDDPLSDKGWAEMRAATATPMPWQALVSSPLARCRAFAEALAAERDLPLGFDSRLMEVGFGEWEGKTAHELKARDPDILARFKQDPVGARPPRAEPLAAFHARVVEGFEAAASVHQGRHCLIVAHAGVIRMMLCHVLGLPLAHAYRIQVGSAAMARFRLESDGGCRLAQFLWLTPGFGE